MPTYVARIRKPSGETHDQIVTVSAQAKLAEALSRIDGFVLDCTPYVQRTREMPTQAASTEVNLRWRSTLNDLVLFSRFLHTLIDAGVPLARALSIVQTQMELPAWRLVLGRVVELLEKGESLADSMRKFPRFFPDFFVHLIEVGEISGNLDKVLEELANFGERQLETRSQVRGALTYPTVLIVASFLVTLFLMGFVLPRLSTVFLSLNVELPWLTKTLLGIGLGIRDNVALILIGFTGLAFAIPCLLRAPGARNVIDTWLLELPVAGNFYRKVVLGRFCRTLALLQKSGVSLLVSLELARKGLRNRVLEKFMESVEREIKEGAPLGKELARSPHIPEMVSAMVSVGEESGRLSEMFENVARWYEREIERMVRILPKLIEPAVIAGMTVVVGIIAASIFIPLADLPQAFGGGK